MSPGCSSACGLASGVDRTLQDRHPPGVVESLRHLSGSLAALAQNRIELRMLELHDERIRLPDVMPLTATIVPLAVLATVRVSLLLVVLFRDQHRLAVVAGLTTFYCCEDCGSKRGRELSQPRPGWDQRTNLRR